MAPRNSPLRREPAAPKPLNVQEIAPPGKLGEEDRDSALTGGTRSLQRRVMGLAVLQPHVGKKSAPARRGTKPKSSAKSARASD